MTASFGCAWRIAGMASCAPKSRTVPASKPSKKSGSNVRYSRNVAAPPSATFLQQFNIAVRPAAQRLRACANDSPPRSTSATKHRANKRSLESRPPRLPAAPCVSCRFSGTEEGGSALLAYCGRDRSQSSAALRSTGGGQYRFQCCRNIIWPGAPICARRQFARWRALRESNPCFRRERAMSWTARRRAQWSGACAAKARDI
jgi:hypothetical protein